jgi:hypothetical protein
MKFAEHYWVGLPKGYQIKQDLPTNFDQYHFGQIDSMKREEFSGALYFADHSEEMEKRPGFIENDLEGEMFNQKMNWKVYHKDSIYVMTAVVDSKSNDNFNSKIHVFGRGFSESDIHKLITIYATIRKE